MRKGSGCFGFRVCAERCLKAQIVQYGGSGGSSLLSLLKLQVIHILMSFNTHVIPILYLFHVNLIITLISIAFSPDITNTNHTYDIKIDMTWKKKRIWHENKNVYDVEKNAYDIVKNIRFACGLKGSRNFHFSRHAREKYSRVCAEDIRFMSNAPYVISVNSFKNWIIVAIWFELANWWLQRYMG